MPDGEIRPVVAADVPTVLELVRDLGDYEKARSECRLTEQQLHGALFGDRPALFAHVAEKDSRVVGVALWFLTFSTWTGTRGIHLEDLYVRPEYRGAGLGRALLRRLATECVAHGYARLEWTVLDWNTPAIDFYRSVGAVPMTQWSVFRLSGEPLSRLGG